MVHPKKFDRRTEIPCSKNLIVKAERISGEEMITTTDLEESVQTIAMLLDKISAMPLQEEVKNSLLIQGEKFFARLLAAKFLDRM